MDAGIETHSGSAQAGFTLVELLVSVAVLAVLGVGASLALGRGPGSSDAAARFERSFEASRQLAVSGQQMRGMRITPRGMQPVLDGAQGWQDLGRATRWQERVSFVAAGPALPGGWPEIVFLPNGRTSAFSIRFGTGRGSLRCASDGWTGLSCDGV